MSHPDWLATLRQEFPAYLATAMLGSLATLLVERFRRRLVRLQWSVVHQVAAVSGNDPVFGTVEVTHNGTKVSRLLATTVTVINQSGNDLSNVPIAITFPDGTVILRGTGGVVGQPTLAPLPPAYVEEFLKALDVEQPDAALKRRIAFMKRHRPFDIRTLNRRAIAKFEFLIEAPLEGRVEVTVDKEGVRPIEIPANPRLVLGVPYLQASWTGLVVIVVALTAILFFYRDPFGLVAITFLLAGFGEQVGAAFVRAGRWLRNLLD